MSLRVSNLLSVIFNVYCEMRKPELRVNCTRLYLKHCAYL